MATRIVVFMNLSLYYSSIISPIILGSQLAIINFQDKLPTSNKTELIEDILQRKIIHGFELEQTVELV